MVQFILRVREYNKKSWWCLGTEKLIKLIFYSEMHQILYIRPELDHIQDCLLEGRGLSNESPTNPSKHIELWCLSHILLIFFLFYLLKLVLVFGNSPNAWSCLFDHVCTHSALFWVSGTCQAAGSEESEMSKQCKAGLPASTQWEHQA